jgi:3-oxoacyl-[acyl-carrier-protein] synthase-3
VVTNHDLAARFDTSHEWIVERSGIHERRWADPETSTSDLAAEAARAAVADAGVPLSEVDCLILATLSPDHEFPGTGVFTQRKLGLGPIAVFDIRQQCSGFVYGLAMADAFLRSGLYRRVLVIGAETQSRALDLTDRGRQVSVLFGDGAGAALLGPGDAEHGLLASCLHADGADAEILWLEKPGFARPPFISEADLAAGRHFPHMEGRKVFKHAVTRMPEAVREVTAAAGLTPADLDLLIPHQANQRITEAVGEALGLSADQVHGNIARVGNTTAASIPLCLLDARAAGKLRPGALVCLAAFGAGLTWGANLLRWG